jgi:hypothetical protein
MLLREEIIEELDKIECPWIEVYFKNQPTIFRCTRCGDTEPFPTHGKLDWVINLGRAFRMTHWDCEEKIEVSTAKV